MLRHIRTTIRLPDELYQQVRVSAASNGETVTAFISAALRAALAHRERVPGVEPYRVTPFPGSGLRPGVDLDDNAATLEIMDADARP